MSSSTGSTTFLGLLVAIWVHGRHDVDPRALDQVSHFRIRAEVLAEVLDEVQEQLSPHNFIPMHVTNILELWLTCKHTARPKRQ